MGVSICFGETVIRGISICFGETVNYLFYMLCNCDLKDKMKVLEIASNIELL